MHSSLIKESPERLVCHVRPNRLDWLYGILLSLWTLGVITIVAFSGGYAAYVFVAIVFFPLAFTTTAIETEVVLDRGVGCVTRVRRLLGLTINRPIERAELSVVVVEERARSWWTRSRGFVGEWEIGVYIQGRQHSIRLLYFDALYQTKQEAIASARKIADFLDLKLEAPEPLSSVAEKS